MLPKNPNAPKLVFQSIPSWDGTTKYDGLIEPYNPSKTEHRYCYIWPFPAYFDRTKILVRKECVGLSEVPMGIVLGYDAKRRLNTLKNQGWHIMSPNLEKGAFMMGYKVNGANSALRVGLKFQTGEVFMWYSKQLVTVSQEERDSQFDTLVNMLTMLAPMSV